MPGRCLLLLIVAAVFTVAAAPPPQKKESFSEVDGSVTIDGKKIEYRATSGRLAVKDRTGKAQANVFFMAYVKKDVEKTSTRPITFCFNGGPGSSSVWLHLGAFGPRRVLMNDDGRSAPNPKQGKLVENEYSLLDLTDLVFIDPVSTGFSRADDVKEAKLFHGVEEDVSSVGDFIRAYVAKYKRGDSPTYVAGESYGTTRASALSSYLQDRAGMKLSGVILVSAVLDFGTIRFGEGNDLPYTLFLPTYAATAWYHKKLDRTEFAELTAAVKQAHEFAEGDYATALRKGNRLSEDERKATARKMAKLTGLSEEVLLKSDLRVDAVRFRRELLRDKNEVTGRYDSRIVGNVKGGGKGGGGDPSYTVVLPPFSSAMTQYLAEGLKYKSDLRYQVMGAQVQPWNYGEAGNNRYVNVAPRLRAAMLKNPSLRVFVANGYYDLATPFAGTEHVMSHLGPKAVTDRVTMSYYEGGHMMYTHKDSLKKLKADVAKFMAGDRPTIKTE